MNLSFSVDDADVKRIMGILPDLISEELSVAIDNSVDHVKELIMTDYKREGELTPSYLNPSSSGLGFTDRTGTLRASIQSWVEEFNNKTVGYVAAGTDYDKYVELLWGGKYSYMLPALMQSQAFINNEVGWAVIRAIEKI